MEIKDLHRIFLDSSGVSTDTRSLSSGNIFFALKGDNFNANEFVDIALKMGALACIVDEKPKFENNNIVLVDCVLETLQELAHFHRQYLGIPIIAITGSNGKTTSKELINSVLSKKYKTQATVGNYNNHIGVPLTLLKMTSSTEIGIVEFGANHLGEIEHLSKITSPNYGYITNFGKAHLEGFGGQEGVIKGKSELYKYLIENNGTIFLNSNDSKQLELIGEHSKIIPFPENNCDNPIEFCSVKPFVSVKAQNTIILTKLIGKYNFSNIAAAITVGYFFNVNFKDIKDGIESYIPKNNRSQILKTEFNTVILDAYNANPSSMIAALDNFNSMNYKDKIVILGDMFELGESSENEHQAIIDYVHTLNFKSMYFIGESFFSQVKDFYSAKFFKNKEAFKNYIKSNPIQNSQVLIKGSRGMQLEKLKTIL